MWINMSVQAIPSCRNTCRFARFMLDSSLLGKELGIIVSVLLDISPDALTMVTLDIVLLCRCGAVLDVLSPAF